MKRLIILITLLLPSICQADAIMMSRAMTADNIAEFYIEKEYIRLELEINLNDIPAFKNLLPQEIYQDMEFGDEPFIERVQKFFEEDLIVQADGQTLSGKIVRLGPKQRLKRDTITGEPLQDDQNELVLFGEFIYPLKEKPKMITFIPPQKDGYVAATIGFMAYHQSLAVNDFRYLSQAETLELDWSDPWYSKFENKNLKRYYVYPMAAFLYIDPFEVRKEIIVRPKDLQDWLDLGIEGKEVLTPEDQEAIKLKAAEFFAGNTPVTINGKEAEGFLDRVHFIQRSLKMTSVVDSNQDLPVNTATLGIIYVFPVAGLPQEADMKWELFNDRIQKIYSSATDEAGGFLTYLDPDNPVLVWKNFLKNPTIPKLIEIDPPVKPQKIFGFTNPFDSSGQLSEDEAREVVLGLLKNVYHAFDFREEGDSFDILARSVDGELLTDIYLETRRSLELKNQGGAKVKIKEVDITGSATSYFKGEAGFQTRAQWQVAGSVGHWGHIHIRRNQYEAMITVKPIEGQWKITQLEILEEKRL